MIRPSFRFFVAAIAAALAGPAVAIEELIFRSSVETAKVPLTTESSWKLDPEAQNPHRRAWVLKRRVKLDGLKAVPVDGTFHRPSLDGLNSEVTIYLRAEPRRYSELESFPCTREPTDLFSTQAGALKAAEEAARLWNQALAAARDELAVRIGRIRADGAEKTLRIANYYFNQWKRDVEDRWAAKVEERARRKEWAYYRAKAAQAKLCKAGSRPKPDTRSWKDLIEPPVSPTNRGELLVRVPARRWNGVFGVRGTVEVGGLRLNGHFIIDSSSPHSMLSPSWMESQGMNPQVIEAFSQGSRTFRWTGGVVSGRRVMVDSLEISSYPFELDEFYLVETKVFMPPESIAPCCDGVLGRDFLIHHPIEFNPGVERDFVRVFARAGFSRAAGTPWVEAAVEQDELVSGCVVKPAGRARPRPPELRGVSWLTAAAGALSVPAAAAERWKGVEATVRCGDLSIVERARVGTRKDAELGDAAVGVGMGVLGRGPFTLDLPHGRIWFTNEALVREVESNRSGLVLDFTLEKGERTLRVKEIRPKSPAAGTLLKEGIRPGARVLEINGREAAELDLWNVNRFLTGARGDRITLKVARKDADKLVPVKVRP